MPLLDVGALDACAARVDRAAAALPVPADRALLESRAAVASELVLVAVAHAVAVVVRRACAVGTVLTDEAVHLAAAAADAQLLERTGEIGASVARVAAGEDGALALPIQIIPAIGVGAGLTIS